MALLSLLISFLVLLIIGFPIAFNLLLSSIIYLIVWGYPLTLITQRMFEGRTTGRSGARAVMGSKNLSAIAVKGSGKIEPEKPEDYNIALREIRQVVKNEETILNFLITAKTTIGRDGNKRIIYNTV